MWYKEALDLTNILEESGLHGIGVYGDYYTYFRPKTKRKLTDTIGRLDHDQGIKHFHSDVSDYELARENLAFLFLAPYIKSMTGFNVPIPSSKSSMSTVFTGKFMITQNMPGVHIYGKRVLDNYIFLEKLGGHMTNFIRAELKSIGVRMLDLHVKNYLVNEHELKNVVQQYIKFCHERNLSEFSTSEYLANEFLNNNPGSWTPLTKDISLVDFGQMLCTDSVAEKCGLKEFKDKLYQYSKRLNKVKGVESDDFNHYISEMITAIISISDLNENGEIKA